MRPVGRSGRLAETGFGAEPRERPDRPALRDVPGPLRSEVPAACRAHALNRQGGGQGWSRSGPAGPVGCPAFENSARTPTDQTEQPRVPIMGVRPAPGQLARHGVGVWPKEGPALALG